MTKRELLDALRDVNDDTPVTMADGAIVYVIVHPDTVIITDVPDRRDERDLD